MPAWELAQVNIGIIKGPMDSPVMPDFAANLERINAVAEAFSFRTALPAPDASAALAPARFDDTCPAA